MSVERTRIKFAQDSDEEVEDSEEVEDETDDEEYEPVRAQIKPEDEGMDDMEYLRSKMTDDFSDSDDADEENEEDDDEEEDEDGDDLQEQEVKPERRRKKKRKSLLSDDDDNEEDSDDDAVSGEEIEEKAPSRVEEEEEDLGESGRLFIRNLSYEVTEEQLEELCRKFGPVAEVHLPIDKISKKCKGFAYVLFMMPAHAVVAQRDLDGTIYQGRLIHVLPARSKQVKKKTELRDQTSSFKAAKEQERRANAGSDHNWNSLFLNQDAVVASMQENYGLEKSEILDPESSNMAVRVALGETHAISSTKAFLEENGVNVAAFTADGAKLQARSKTVILVKNLSADCNETELRQLFSKFGNLGRLLLAPSKVLALAEFLEPTEARSAFSSLAYSRFKHIPLYLEWAPQQSFTTKPSDNAQKSKEEDTPINNVDDHELEESSCTLYVTNLSFDTTEASLLAAVKRKTKGARAVTVATKANPKGGAPLSRGFGFVEFASKEEAASALMSLQGMDVDGHKIKLKLSTRTSVKASGTATQSRSKSKKEDTKGRKSDTKVIVRNMPFEATKKELQQLFHTFGQVKTVRMPRKFDGSHRGFAFVEFLSKEEAKNAVEALSGTHLYGRHLVIEFADLDESMELIREKAKRDLDTVHKHEGKPSKKKKQTPTED